MVFINEDDVNFQRSIPFFLITVTLLRPYNMRSLPAESHEVIFVCGQCHHVHLYNVLTAHLLPIRGDEQIQLFGQLCGL